MINRRAGYGILTARFIKKLTSQILWDHSRDIVMKGKEKVVQFAELTLLLIISMKEHQLLFRDFHSYFKLDFKLKNK